MNNQVTKLLKNTLGNRTFHTPIRIKPNESTQYSNCKNAFGKRVTYIIEDSSDDEDFNNLCDDDYNIFDVSDDDDCIYLNNNINTPSQLAEQQQFVNRIRQPLQSIENIQPNPQAHNRINLFEGIVINRQQPVSTSTYSNIKKHILQTAVVAKEDEHESLICKVCTVHIFNAIIEPCRHVMCSFCAKQLNTCPFCRASIVDKCNFFLP